jgi:hypothetical protein
MSDTDSVFASKESGVASVPDAQTNKDDLILQSEALKRDLFIMERVVNLNTYQPKQASYRGFNIIEGTSSSFYRDFGTVFKKLCSDQFFFKYFPIHALDLDRHLLR